MDFETYGISQIKGNIEFVLVCDTWKGSCRSMTCDRHDPISPNSIKVIKVE